MSPGRAYRRDQETSCDHDCDNRGCVQLEVLRNTQVCMQLVMVHSTNLTGWWYMGGQHMFLLSDIQAVADSSAFVTTEPAQTSQNAPPTPPHNSVVSGVARPAVQF